MSPVATIVVYSCTRRPLDILFVSGEPVKRARLELEGGLTPSLVANDDIVPVLLGPIDLTPPKDPKILLLFVL